MPLLPRSSFSGGTIIKKIHICLQYDSRIGKKNKRTNYGMGKPPFQIYIITKVWHTPVWSSFIKENKAQHFVFY